MRKLKVLVCIFFLIPAGLIAQNVMWVDTVSAEPKQTVQFAVKIQNADPFVAFQCDINLPLVVLYVNSSAQLTSPRANGHQLAVTLLKPNTLRIVAYSNNGTPFIGNSGSVLVFQCQTKTQPGIYSLELVNPIIGNGEQSNILTGFRNGQFTLLAPDIRLDIESLDFGSIPLGTSNERSITISNIGTTSLGITKLTTSHKEIKLIDSSTVTIQSNGSVSRVIRFLPTIKGSKSGILKISSTDPDDTLKTVNLTAHAYAVNEIHVGSTFARSGNNAQLSISINNMEPFVGFEFNLQLPTVMKYIAGSAQLTSRKTDHVISAQTLANNVLKVVAYSPTNSSFTGTDGNVVTLTFNVEGQGGNYSIPISNALIGHKTDGNVISASYGGNLEVAAPDIQIEPTQIDHGSVSTLVTDQKTFTIYDYGTDTLKVASILFYDPHFTTDVAVPFVILPWQNRVVPVNFHSDLKGSFSSSIRIRSNDPDEDPMNISATATAFIPNIVRVDSSSIVVDQEGWASISIENHEPFVGFQFDLQLPEGFSYAGQSQLTTRAVDHSLSFSLISTDVLRVFAYSLTQAAILDNDGTVLNVKLSAGSQPGYFPIQLSNVIIGNARSENIVSSYENGTVSVLGTKALTLNTGWNLVSWNYNTTNDSLISMFAPVLDKTVVVLGFEKIGLTYDPKWPQFSNLHFVDHLHGYWLNLSAENSFSLIGSYVSPSTPIELEAGWNLVSYLPNSVDDIVHALQSIYSDLIVVLGFEQGGLTYDPNWPQFSNLQQMKPGFGYWIKVRNACNLMYPTSKYLAKKTQSINSTPSSVTPTTEWISILGEGISIDGKLIRLGSTVRVLDKNGVVCGFGKVSQEGCFGMISVYRDDPNTSIDEGAEPGEEVVVYINDSPLPEKVVWKEKGDVIHLTGQKDDTKTAPQDYELIRVFPNPFNSQTSIQFSLPNIEKVEITIINTNGEMIRKIANDVLPPGEHSLCWDGSNSRGQTVASGIYMIQIKSNSIHHLQKVVYVR